MKEGTNKELFPKREKLRFAINDKYGKKPSVYVDAFSVRHAWAIFNNKNPEARREDFIVL